MKRVVFHCFRTVRRHTHRNRDAALACFLKECALYEERYCLHPIGKSTIYIKRCRNEERKAICYCGLYCVQEYFLKWNFPGSTFFKLFKSKTSLETCLEIVNE